MTELTAVPTATDRDYRNLEKQIAQRVANLPGPLFTTSAEGLWQAYLEGIPEIHRQHYNCNCCRRFIERYGGLAFLNDHQEPHSPIWVGEDDIPDFFSLSMSNLFWKVKKAKITGVFINSDKVWGTSENVAVSPKYRGTRWTHLAGTPNIVYHNPLKTAHQMMAEKREDYIILKRGLSEIALEATEQAVRVLEADALDRSEKTLGVAQWLLELQQSLAGKQGTVRDNLVWLAVATAPPGFCHIRSTMIATLLDDIAAGLDYGLIRRRWAEKMHPLQYQRPATISEGVIAQANKIMEKLGAEGALERRFARLEDVIQCCRVVIAGDSGIVGTDRELWLPSLGKENAKEVSKGGVFDHLSPKRQPIKELELPAVTMTWERFRKEVLPNALEVAFKLPYGRESFYGLVTAANPAAPPIIQWDGLKAVDNEGKEYPLPRNPVSWYYYHGGSSADGWSLVPGEWCRVTAIFLKPSQWQQKDKFKHQGESVHFALEGAIDKGYQRGALFFPENLRTEYHAIRQVIEAYSQKSSVTDKEEGNVNGIALQKGNQVNYFFRVKTEKATSLYQLDRWE